ncbi:5'-nucleotidase C-terminal domain-containing protein [Domibacillus enclensis]|uniref:2',3'-cyclic-nucleotide 2'-phosphodiesterase / 3'-nucleotidase / 5'-nucleotidase n=1 Tax=Domibacillus enclensis TaxID=1017273 RepID=A0A1N6S377_9BACI|nr:5'-nucleotidase C-terminal domain-containing protein [Domibacillus enclensis]SIQ35544.1 2',3'-cyclic-nucleotide 2'-phosphodiesterase / 3'-nucleotidase / 5'-nucleotidase [Domibacillus enclensis]
MNNKNKFIAAAAVASVTVSAAGASAATGFTDVPAKYEEAVQFLTENEITAGFSEGTFGTSMSITRVDAAIQLAKALGFTEEDTYEDAGFTDVPERGQWAVNALAEWGVTNGKAPGKFGAFEPITRGEASYWLATAYGLEVDETATETPFTDVNERFGPYVNALVESGLSLGKTATKFGAADQLLRGEWALFLYRGAQLPEDFLLSLIHTNDTHAHIENVARKATVVEALREENPSSLLVDAGDVFSGTLYFNEFKGQADLEFMNLLGYDAMTFGNHEFDLGTEPLAEFVKKAKFPFVSANVNAETDANLSSLMNETVTDEPMDGEVYNGIIKEVDGEKVGIFGLTTAETKTISSPGDDVVFEDYIEEAEKAVSSFEEAGVNKIVALTHIGFQDGGGDNDVTLAKEVDGIDVIVGGHSHDKLDEPYIDETGAEPTVIVQANEYNKFVGTLDVIFDEDGMVTEYAGELIEVDAKNEDETYVFEENEEVKNMLATKYTPAIDEVKAQVVGSATAALDGERASVRTKETDLGNLITDAMLAKAKTIDSDTVIALQNGGGIRASIDAGDITMEEVLTVMPFGNALAIMDLTGAEIKAALEHSVSLAPEQNGAFLQVAGLKFTYDSSKEAGSRVTSVEVNEGGTFTALDEAKTYAVATNTFTAKGGDNYAMFKVAYDDGRVSEPGFVDWETFTEYLAANPEVDAAVEGRITDSAAQ